MPLLPGLVLAPLGLLTNWTKPTGRPPLYQPQVLPVFPSLLDTAARK